MLDNTSAQIVTRATRNICARYQRGMRYPLCRQVPFFFKWAVDGLTTDPSGATPIAAGVLCLTPPALLMMYGVTRAVAAACNELRNAVFANVSDSAPLAAVTQPGCGLRRTADVVRWICASMMLIGTQCDADPTLEACTVLRR